MRGVAKRRADDALKAVLDAGRSVNVTDLAVATLSAFGGCDRLARHLYELFEELKEKPASTIARAKILEMVTRLVITSSVQNKDRGGGPEQMTDEQLYDTLDRFLQRRGGADGAQADDAG